MGMLKYGIFGASLALTLVSSANAAMFESPTYTSFISTTVNNTWPNYDTTNIDNLPAFPSSNIAVGNSYARVQSAVFNGNTGFSFTTSQQYDASTGSATKSWVNGYLFITVDATTTITYNASTSLTIIGTPASSSLSFGIMNPVTNSYYAYQSVNNQSGNKSISYTLQPLTTYKVFYSMMIDPKAGASGLTTANTSFDFSLGTGSVPEPASLALLSSSAVALLMRRRR